MTRRVALVYGVPVGDGGLAVQTANAIAGIAASGAEIHAIGPGLKHWPRTGPAPEVEWHSLAPANAAWMHWPFFRSFQGRAQWQHDSRIGRASATWLARVRPDLVYAFTLVALESLQWARANGVPTILESPNGHIRAFRDVYVEEHRRWCRGAYRGHPTRRMVARVEEEYRLADRIRVSSEWAKRSLVSGGVPAEKIAVLQQPVDLVKYRPAEPAAPSGRLRVVTVGTLDLRKGFVYLLEALRQIDAEVEVQFVGGTVDRCTRHLFGSRAAELRVNAGPGDPRPALAWAEVFVFPTLEDGSPFAVAEAMASGRPVIVTDRCGAAEWIDPGASGWIVQGRDAGALARALEEAERRRRSLPGMGEAARRATERRADTAVCDSAVASYVGEALR